MNPIAKDLFPVLWDEHEVYPKQCNFAVFAGERPLEGKCHKSASIRFIRKSIHVFVLSESPWGQSDYNDA